MGSRELLLRETYIHGMLRWSHTVCLTAVTVGRDGDTVEIPAVVTQTECGRRLAGETTSTT